LPEKIHFKSWPSCESRVDRSMGQVLQLFQNYETKATLFILGLIAERYFGPVKKNAEAGYEIGWHGFSHQRIQCQRRH
jgi:peptidoglycan/xylan/chitin deacetylase (PgdA/CDA1 family)